LREVIDEYVRLGFRSVFIRPLNPFGLAKREWATLGYEPEEFLSAYKDALAYIVALNRSGAFFSEFYATLLLTRILTPFSTGFVDLQSPAVGGVVYDHDGTVYPSDEGRMLARTGDRRFALGNVHTHTYEDIFLGEALRALVHDTCIESLPECVDCAYHLYCGVDPVRNYLESGDVLGHRPSSAFCRWQTSLLDYLFDLVRADDNDVMDVFWSWIRDRPLADVRL
jgi:radical SAM protein with 4Fe4S-binding SPASM domain